MSKCPNHNLLRPGFVCLFAIAPLFGLGLSPALAATSPQYTVTDLGAIGYLAEEYNFSQAQLFRVNDNGFVAGTSAVSTASKAVVREPGATGFTFLPDEDISAANAINSSNVIVGWSQVNHEPRATVWQKDGAGVWKASILRFPLGDYTKSTAWDINDNGVIAGSVQNVTGKYAVYWPAVDQDPVMVGGGNAFIGEAFAVNNLGRVVGVKGANDNTPISQSYYWDIGSANIAILPTISEGAASWGAVDINEKNMAVGGSGAKIVNNWTSWSTILPYAWSETTGTQLVATNLAWTAWALAVNDAGYIVGPRAQFLANAAHDDPRNRAPIVYRQEADPQGVLGWKEYVLATQIPAGDQPSWWFYSASGISNVGRIVGMGNLGSGTDWHAYMLTPAVSDLSISQTVVAPAAKPGAVRAKLSARAETAQYTQIKLRVLNQGPLVATNVLVQTELPAGLSVDSTAAAGGSCVSTPTANGPTAVRCSFASLPVSSAGNITLSVSASAGGEFEVTSTASATELDTLNEKNNRVSQKVALEAQTQVQVQVSQQSGASSTPKPPADSNSPSAGSSDYSLALLALSAALGRFVRRRREGGGA